MRFSEKRSCLRHSPTHSLGHSHVLWFNFGPIFKESESPNPTLTWTNPIHSWNHRVLAPSPDIRWCIDDGRTQRSGEASSLGVYQCIMVYGKSVYYKAPVLCASNLSYLQITLACLIDLLLVTNVHAREFGGNERIHILNRLQPWRMIHFASSFGSCWPMSLSSLRISLELLIILRSTVWGSEKIHVYIVEIMIWPNHNISPT